MAVHASFLPFLVSLPWLCRGRGAPRHVQHDDEVLVEVYKSTDMTHTGMLGYMQSCKDHADDDWPHVCAYAPRKSLKVGMYGDPSTLASISLVLPEQEPSADPSKIYYASPCNYDGTIQWSHGDNNCITDDDQASWDLHDIEGNLPSGGLIYDTFYFMRHHRWERWLGGNNEGPGCGHEVNMTCLNTNWRDSDPSKVAIKLVNTKAICDAMNVTGWWNYYVTLVGPATESLTYGTQKEHSESKTETWSQSVTISVSGGFQYSSPSGAGGDVQVQVSGTLSHSISEAYSDTWSTSTQETFSETFPANDTGMSVWQFHFNITDTCKHVEEAKTREYALTPNKLHPPCCLPGYGADAPFYTTCVTGESMAPGGKSRGCKVLQQTQVFV